MLGGHAVDLDRLKPERLSRRLQDRLDPAVHHGAGRQAAEDVRVLDSTLGVGREVEDGVDAVLVATRLGVEPEVRFLGALAAGNFSTEPVRPGDWLRILGPFHSHLEVDSFGDAAAQ